MKRLIKLMDIDFRLIHRKSTMENIYCCVCKECSLESVYYQSKNNMNIHTDCAEIKPKEAIK
jgi:hypothetical protein